MAGDSPWQCRWHLPILEQHFDRLQHPVEEEGGENREHWGRHVIHDTNVYFARDDGIYRFDTADTSGWGTGMLRNRPLHENHRDGLRFSSSSSRFQP